MPSDKDDDKDVENTNHEDHQYLRFTNPVHRMKPGYSQKNLEELLTAFFEGGSEAYKKKLSELAFDNSSKEEF